MRRVRVAPELSEGDVVQVVNVRLAHAIVREENIRLIDKQRGEQVPETMRGARDCRTCVFLL